MFVRPDVEYHCNNVCQGAVRFKWNYYMKIFVKCHLVGFHTVSGSSNIINSEEGGSGSTYEGVFYSSLSLSLSLSS